MRAVLTLWIGVFALSSCLQEVGPSDINAKIDTGDNQDIQSPSEEAFSETLFPSLVTHCSTCHGDFQAPLFAVNDLKSSHDLLLSANLVSLSAPSSSRLVTKVASNHQCWTGNCEADSQSLRSQIADWAAGGADNNQGSPAPSEVLNSRVLQIPEDLASCGDGEAFRPVYAISLASESAPSGVILGFDLCSFDQTNYRVSNLRIKTRYDISIKTVRLLVNAVDFAIGGNNWPQIDDVVMGHGDNEFLPAKILRGNSFFVAKGFGFGNVSDGGPGKDTVQLQVESLQLAP